MYYLASIKNETSYLSKKKGKGPESLGIKVGQWNLSTLRHSCHLFMVGWLWQKPLLPKGQSLGSYLSKTWHSSPKFLSDSCPYHTKPILVSSQCIYPLMAIWKFPPSANSGEKMLLQVLSMEKIPLLLHLCLTQSRSYGDEYSVFFK